MRGLTGTAGAARPLAQVMLIGLLLQWPAGAVGQESPAVRAAVEKA